jgi:hypothetical protein
MSQTAPHEYVFGQPVVIEWRVTDPENSYALIDDPTTAVTVYKPDGTTATPAPDHPSTGVYQATIIANQSGWWEWVPLGGGGGRRRFYVGPTP